MGIPVEHFQLLRLLKIFRVFRMKVTATVFALLVCTLLEASAKNLVTFKESTDSEMLDLSHDIMYPEDYDELERDEELEDSRRKRSAEEEEGELIDLSHDYILMPEDYDELERDEDLEDSRRKRSAEVEHEETLAGTKEISYFGHAGRDDVTDFSANRVIACTDMEKNLLDVSEIQATYTCDLLNEELDVSDKLKEICEGKKTCSFTVAQLVGERNCAKTEMLPCRNQTWIAVDDKTKAICEGNTPIVEEQLKEICELVNNPPTERLCNTTVLTVPPTFKWSVGCGDKFIPLPPY